MIVRISQPAKSTKQSVGNNDYWLLEFIRSDNSQFKDSLIGRTSSSDMSNEVKIKFSSCENAVAFAKKNNYYYEVVFSQKSSIIKKSYAQNFK